MRARARLGWLAAPLAMAATAACAQPMLDVSRAIVDLGRHTHIARPRTFVVTNVGDAPWRAPRPVIDGADATAFSVTSRDCPVGTLVPPRARCTFRVGFVP